ncbi:hypothetical protein BC833DRAFT_609049 [Globomyces pollinis-pini]|nr:hypothetical protein BC833DRAFT_609049 [Globomyces pollinis-pini]
MQNPKQISLFVDEADGKPSAVPYQNDDVALSIDDSDHHETSKQPMFPSIYAYREGNAGMLGLIGFYAATFPNSLLELLSPSTIQTPTALYMALFGGVLQVYAGVKDYHHGNSLSSCIFTVFGLHWIAKGLLDSNIAFFKPVETYTVDPSVMGCYLATLTSLNLAFAVLAFCNPEGSYLLVITLSAVLFKLILVTINAWFPATALVQVAGFFGVVGSLLAFYAFMAEALAEEGRVLWTGKFSGVRSRKEAKRNLKSNKSK